MTNPMSLASLSICGTILFSSAAVMLSLTHKENVNRSVIKKEISGIVHDESSNMQTNFSLSLLAMKKSSLSMTNPIMSLATLSLIPCLYWGLATAIFGNIVRDSKKSVHNQSAIGAAHKHTKSSLYL